MNVKIAVVASAGSDIGMMIRQKMPLWPQPSMRAASSSSRGMPRMNCTIRKTKNASVASSFGTISGQYVLIQSSCENRMYCGTITTWIGSMIVPSMMANHSRL
jgi:hypothetical protein